MSVAPHSGIIDFGTFTPPDGATDGIQGEVPQPLAGQEAYVLTAVGWAPGGGGGGAVTQIIAGTNVSISPAGGTGAVTINSTGSGGVSSVTGTAPVVSSGGTTPAISMAKATTLVDGYLSTIDWNTFNNKQPAGSYLTAITATTPLSGSGTSGSPLIIAQASTSTSGYLTSTDWNTFNNKQAAGTYVTSVGATSPVTSTGGTTPTIAMPAATTSVSGYLTSTDWTTFNNKQPAGSYLTAVTADAPLSGSGTSGSHLVIATANTTTTGALTSTDWNTFNGKQATLVSGTNIKTVGSTSLLGSGDVPVVTSIVAGTNVTISPVGGTGAVTINATGGGGSTSPAGANTQIQFNNSGAFGASANLTWDGTTAKATNVETTGGVLADGNFSGTYVDGIVVDYDPTGSIGRISVGGSDGLNFYNGGVAGSLLGSVANNGDWSLTRFLDVGNGSLVGGATNPIIAAAGSAAGYVQIYIHNDNAGSSSSADLAAYPDNGTDASGYIDMGITSSTYSDATYPIYGANEGYIIMSNPSTATTATGNLVFATDSTGTTNAFQWYVGSFTVAKTAYKMQLDGTNLYVKQAFKADGVIESTTGGFKFPDATTQTTSAFPSTTANKVLASPDGSTGTPSYRALVSNDIPDLLLTKLPEAWPKMSANAATTANITLSGTQTIDGVALVAGNRCLVKNQTAGQDNGIYDVSASTWTRSADANTTSKIAGAAVNVDAGTINGGKIYDTDLKTTDTLGTTAMNWYALVDTNGATFGGTLTLRAGTATAGTAPLYMTSGTNLTTAAAGAVEYDGNTPYFSIAASTRGVLPTEQIVVLTGTNTLTSQTGVQPIFDGGGGPTNGSVTLPIGTYQFECVYALTAMSATSGSFGFALGGAATKTYTYDATASKAGTAAATSQAGFKLFSSAAATALVTNSTGTVGSAVIKGIIRVTSAGTIIPQVSLTVASAAIVSANSYFKVSPLGNVSTVATVGNWA